MNRIFRSLWNPSLGAWVATPEISRGRARAVSGSDGASNNEDRGRTLTRADLPLHAIALSVLLLGAALALPAGAAGGTGGQPTSDTSLHAGSGGSDTQGGSGGLNDTTVNAHGGDGGASTETGASAGSSADIGSFAGATPGSGGAAGATTTLVGPGTWQGDAGAAGQSQTGDFANGNGYG
ncbi:MULTISPECIES: ESPR domain-containing protein, partial [Variovorax]|uniref:ESPR domain-containing protein n=1 Tax=Variovorax TaxID=34072 RepID=UPI00285C7A2B